MTERSHRPTAEYRYWLYDPEGDGMTYYRTAEARDSEAQKAIDCYLEDGWAPEVEFVSAGEVTHCAQVLDKTMRPAGEDLDDEGCDGDGMYWPEGMAWRGNYALEPLPPNAEVRGDAPLYGAASLSTDGLCGSVETKKG